MKLAKEALKMMTKKMKILTTNIQNPLSSCKVSFYTEVTYICLVKGEQLTTNTQNSYSLVLYKHIHPCRPGRIRIRICPCVTDPVGPPPYWKKSLKFVPGRGKPLNICLHWEKMEYYHSHCKVLIRICRPHWIFCIDNNGKQYPQL